MLINRETILQDTAVDRFTDAILAHDQARTADIFFSLVRKEGRSIGDALSVVTAAEAPFVQVPNHINVRDGQITLINNDHTILGLRTSAHLMPYLPEEYRLLAMLQSVWYIPAGLDIWNQLLGRYPGRYATMKNMHVPLEDKRPVVWNEDQQPIVENGSIEERLHSYMIATMAGDVRRSYGLFLGLAADPAIRPRLRDTLMFIGLVDVQETIAGRKARNTGHKALRARAIVDLADYIGWDRAHGVFYTGVPDMAVGPLYFSAYDAACVLATEEFPNAGKDLEQTNRTPLSPAGVEAFIAQLMTADSDTIWDQVTAHLKAGISIRSLGDTIAVAAAEIILRTTEPRRFTDGQHAFDYCNTANMWLRSSDSPYKARIVYLMANFVNDAAVTNKLFEPVLQREAAGFTANGKSAAEILRGQDEIILAFDFPRATASAAAYLEAGGDPRAFMAATAITACKFQDDPHNQKISHSTFEEWEHNTTHLKDRMLLATVRQLAGWPKMPGDRDCYARFEKDWKLH